MNRVKTKNRNLLSDERSPDLTLLAFERDITMSLHLDDVIDVFGTEKNRRVPLVP